jgi:hypothetical protein
MPSDCTFRVGVRWSSSGGCGGPSTYDGCVCSAGHVLCPDGPTGRVGALVDRWECFDAGPRVDAPSPVDAGADAGSTVYSSWTECGWSDPSCTCDGVLDCAAVAGGAFAPLGSSQARVCAIDGDDCVIVTFRETEGGGVAERCRIPRTALACSDGVVATSGGTCEQLYTCNLLMGDCPSDIALGSSVIHCQ